MIDHNKTRPGFVRAAIRTSCLAPILLSLPLLGGTALRDDGGGQSTLIRRDLSVSEWADRIWSSAKEGDFASVERDLRGVPEGRARAGIERLRSAVETLDRTRSEAAAEKATELDKALADAKRFASESEIPKALASASMAKLLSDDWKKTLAGEELTAIVAKSETVASDASSAGDLLLAQEVLFRLRVLVDDLDDKSRRDQYQKPLEEINRRIGLLAQYAPHRLHDLREMQAKRLRPKEPFAPFNELGAEDWKDQLRGITQPMLMSALRTAASEHIDNQGWWPLLTGGLEAVRILATTSALDESFPMLKEQDRVKSWVETIDTLQKEIDSRPRKALSRADYREVIGRLIQANRETIELPEAALFREFGDGATFQLSELYDDQYTEIIWPERLRRFEQQTEGNFVGVGILIRQDDKREIIVVNPLEGSPAFRAGVKSEDRIVSVDGSSTTGWSLNRAVDMITGPRGKEVTLTVRRTSAKAQDERTLDIPIVRDTIKIRSVNGWWKRELDADGNPKWDWLIDPFSRIGYVRLTSFNEDSYADFLLALEEMKSGRDINGLILDIRGNPGGLLNSAVQFSNLFVQRGEIVSGEDKNGKTVFRREAHPNRAEALLAGVPTVVLINQGSASASEIVSGCLQAHGAAVVLGERSFGKGSVQTVHDATDGGAAAAIKLTTQFYVLPPKPGEAHGRLVHRRPDAKDWGVNPDIVVAMTPQQMEKSMRLRLGADNIGGGAGEADTDDEPPADETKPNEVPADERKPGDDGKIADARKSRPDVNELLTKGLDPQLQTALLILQARAIKNLEEAAIARR